MASGSASGWFTGAMTSNAGSSPSEPSNWNAASKSGDATTVMWDSRWSVGRRRSVAQTHRVLADSSIRVLALGGVARRPGEAGRSPLAGHRRAYPPMIVPRPCRAGIGSDRVPARSVTGGLIAPA